jgi:hypothetical protein
MPGISRPIASASATVSVVAAPSPDAMFIDSPPRV